MKFIISESQINLINESDVEAKQVSVDWAKKFKSDLGLTDAAAAAIAANIEHESGFIPNKIQMGFGPSTGTLSQSKDGGYSWAQWTFGKRKKAFRNYVLKTFGVDINKTPATSEQAYSFMKYELLNPKNNLFDKKESLKYHDLDFNSFKSIKNVDVATEKFVSDYEKAGKPMLDKRKKLAKNILNRMKGITSSKKPESNVHTVVAGDTLSVIAKKYKTTVDNIKKINKLSSDAIKIGQKLKYK